MDSGVIKMPGCKNDMLLTEGIPDNLSTVDNEIGFTLNVCHFKASKKPLA
jgi:hypothetical protein